MELYKISCMLSPVIIMSDSIIKDNWIAGKILFKGPITKSDIYIYEQFVLVTHSDGISFISKFLPFYYFYKKAKTITYEGKLWIWYMHNDEHRFARIYPVSFDIVEICRIDTLPDNDFVFDQYVPLVRHLKKTGEMYDPSLVEHPTRLSIDHRKQPWAIKKALWDISFEFSK